MAWSWSFFAATEQRQTALLPGHEVQPGPRRGCTLKWGTDTTEQMVRTFLRWPGMGDLCNPLYSVDAAHPSGRYGHTTPSGRCFCECRLLLPKPACLLSLVTRVQSLSKASVLTILLFLPLGAPGVRCGNLVPILPGTPPSQQKGKIGYRLWVPSLEEHPTPRSPSPNPTS